MPGYAACFPSLWENPAALTLALQLGLEDFRQATRVRLRTVLDKSHVGAQGRTLERVMQWAKNAAEGDVVASHHRRIAAGEHAAVPSVPARVEELTRIQEHRCRGPQPLGEILPAVLATLGVKVIQSPLSGAIDPA